MCDDARMTVGTNAFRAARDLLLLHRTEYESARLEFAWPARGSVRLLDVGA